MTQPCQFTRSQERAKPWDTNGDLAGEFTQQRNKQNDRQEPSMLADTRKESNMVVESEHENLSLHVQLCQARYANVGGRLEKLDERLTDLETKVSDLKVSQQQGFADIKLLLERQNTHKQTQIVATFGTIITAILGFIGYILAK